MKKLWRWFKRQWNKPVVDDPIELRAWIARLNERLTRVAAERDELQRCQAAALVFEPTGLVDADGVPKLVSRQQRRPKLPAEATSEL